jgi:rare lipoprotein A (peptidoglycan hydrolase)
LRRRIVDVSKAAARQLDFIALGETRVSIELVSLDDTDSICATADTAQAFYRVQEIDRGFTGFSVRLGTYLMQDVAFDIAHNLKQQTNVEVFVQSAVKQSGYIYRVYAGRFAGKNDAEQWKEKIKEFYPNASVVQFMP